MVLKRIMESVGKWANVFYEAGCIVGVGFCCFVGVVVLQGASFIVVDGGVETELGFSQMFGVICLIVGLGGLLALFIRGTTAIWSSGRKWVSKRYRAGKFLWEE